MLGSGLILKLELKLSRQVDSCKLQTGIMAYNGPAIKGGCGTWRSPSVHLSWYFSRNLSRWQDRDGVLFANLGTSFIALRRALPTVAERRWDRGISFQVDEYLSRYTKMVNGQLRSVAV